MDKVSQTFKPSPTESSVKIEDTTKRIDWQTAAEGSSVMFGWPQKQTDMSDLAPGNRQTLGHDPEHRRDPLEGTLFKRVYDKEDHNAG